MAVHRQTVEYWHTAELQPGLRVNDFNRVGSRISMPDPVWVLTAVLLVALFVCSKRMVYYCQVELDLHLQITTPASFLIHYLIVGFVFISGRDSKNVHWPDWVGSPDQWTAGQVGSRVKRSDPVPSVPHGNIAMLTLMMMMMMMTVPGAGCRRAGWWAARWSVSTTSPRRSNQVTAARTERPSTDVATSNQLSTNRETPSPPSARCCPLTTAITRPQGRPPGLDGPSSVCRRTSSCRCCPRPSTCSQSHGTGALATSCGRRRSCRRNQGIHQGRN